MNPTLAPLRLLFALVLVAGCAPDDTGPPGNPATGADALPTGSFELELHGAQVQVRANEAPRTLILGELASRAGFELAGDRPTDTYSGWFSAAAPEHAIGVLAPGVPYRGEYRPDATGHRLVRIELGSTAAGAASAAPVDAGNAGTPSDMPPSAAPPQDPVAGALYQQWRSDNAYALTLLSSTDATIRTSALDEFEARSGGLVALDRAFADEPDPAARIAILEKIDESGSVVALQSILRGLSDPVPEVVVVAIQLAQDWHDADLTERYLEPLLEHDDKHVRDAAGEAIESLRE